MSEFRINDWVLDDEDDLFQVKRVRDNEIALTDEPFYVPAKEYRLKEKEDGMGNSMELNNFQDYGFTADFAGEILKEIEGTYIGWAKAKHGVISMCWFKNGSVFLSNPNFELAPIKK
jgi:hypothetical protein